MNIDIQPVEIDSKHYVGVIMDGNPHRYGPYCTADEAEVAAAWIAAVSRVFHWQVAMQAASMPRRKR